MMPTPKFDFCCTKLDAALGADATQSNNATTFILKVESGVFILYKVGGSVSEQLTQSFLDPVIYCPFCGVKLQDFDAIWSDTVTIWEMDEEVETICSSVEMEETMLAAR